MEDGLYLDLPEDDYHALPRLSASGIKDLQVSPPTFWARSWMNKARREDPPEEKKHFLKGRAYHARICEGLQKFSERYTFEHDPADYPHALVSMDDLRARAKELEVAVGGKKSDVAARIHAAEDERNINRSLIWDLHVEEVRSAHKNCTFLPASWLEDFESGARFVEGNPVISQAFKDGMPEVTILWTHHLEDGRSVPMKTRVDYLKKEVIVDYKTYANPLDMEPSRAIIRAIANYRYWLQVAVYYAAVDFAVDKGWVEKPASPHSFLFVFQGTGDDRSARARVFPRESTYVDLGWRILDNAAATFLDNMERFGPDQPWYNDEQIDVLLDDDFPMWMGD